jgi:hypothetical protein
MAKARVLVVVNKWWEVDPVLYSLLNEYEREEGMKCHWPILNRHPRPRSNPMTPTAPNPATPRALFNFDWGEVEIWCVSDLLDHFPDKPCWQSSAERKAERLPEVLQRDNVRLVIAVGTASAGGTDSINGCVVIGTKCFLHNSKPGGKNPDSDWQGGPFDQVIDSEITGGDFTNVMPQEEDNFILQKVKLKFLPAPLAPATEPRIITNYNAVALGNLNVTDYGEYEQTDEETIKKFSETSRNGSVGSLDTTHGLVRVLGSGRFLYLSGIVDRLGHFKEDVAPRQYAQNTAGAHNAGVALAWLIPRLHVLL